MQAAFAKPMQDIHMLSNSIMDLYEKAWKPAYAKLRADINELEVLFVTAFESTIENSKSFYTTIYNLKVFLSHREPNLA